MLTLEVLQSRRAPPKVASAPKRPSTKKKRAGLAEDEDLITSESEDDFVVPDEPRDRSRTAFSTPTRRDPTPWSRQLASRTQEPQTPEPQTPEPQTPEPQTPEPQTPEPQIPEPRTREPPNYIDLTQDTDTDEPATPPLLRTPHRTPRKTPQKTPKSQSRTLGKEETPDNRDPELLSDHLRTPSGTRPLSDLRLPEEIGTIACSVWQQAKNPRALLICMLWKLGSEKRQGMVECFTSTTLADSIWTGQMERAIKRGSWPLEWNTDRDSLDAIAFSILRLFASYVRCEALDTSHFQPLNKTTAKQIKDGRHQLDDFCNVMWETLPKLPKEGQPETDDADYPGTDDAEETDDPDVNDTNQRRDKTAMNLRKQHKVRLTELDKRRDQLRETLATSALLPEDKTRLIINESKEEDQGFIYVPMNIAPDIKDHQIEGVRSMWNQIIMTQDQRQGFLLAHTMGLGKTMQVITLLVTLAESASSPDPNVQSQVPTDLRKSKTLILCPSGLVTNWDEEIRRWAPHDVLGDVFKVESVLNPQIRIDSIKAWGDRGGLMLIGYDLFSDIVSRQDGDCSRILVEAPNLVVADEAHELKNPRSKRRIAAARIRTNARIALTGSPLNNNLKEYYTMLDWVAPGYLGEYLAFQNEFENPIKHGSWQESDKSQKREARKALNVLVRQVQPLVHRATMKVLEKDLPRKVEFVISLEVTELQKELYNIFVRECIMPDNGPSRARIFALTCNMALICNHPKTFRARISEEKTKGPEDKAGCVFTPALMDKSLACIRANLTDISSPELSQKVQMLMTILDLAREAGDKVLVFSTSMPTIDFLGELLAKKQRRVQTLSGKTPIATRQAGVKRFNEGNTEVFLISTTAGGVGLNIHGANRVVIFDFKWNPQHEQQAVGRAYRIGQKKPVYVYKLICGGTFEDWLQHRGVWKQQLASRVVDNTNPIAWSSQCKQMLSLVKDMEHKNLDGYKGKDQVLDRILDDGVLSKVICNILETDTFEEEDTETQMTADEMKEIENIVALADLRRNDPDAWQKKKSEDEAARRILSSQMAQSLRAEWSMPQLPTPTPPDQNLHQPLNEASRAAGPPNGSIEGTVKATHEQADTQAPVQASVQASTGPPAVPLLGANTRYGERDEDGTEDGSPRPRGNIFETVTVTPGADVESKFRAGLASAFKRTNKMFKLSDPSGMSATVTSRIQEAMEQKALGKMPENARWRFLGGKLASFAFLRALTAQFIPADVLVLAEEKEINSLIENGVSGEAVARLTEAVAGRPWQQGQQVGQAQR